MFGQLVVYLGEMKIRRAPVEVHSALVGKVLWETKFLLFLEVTSKCLSWVTCDQHILSTRTHKDVYMCMLVCVFECVCGHDRTGGRR